MAYDPNTNFGKINPIPSLNHIDTLSKRIDALESNQKQFIKELKEYLMPLEMMVRSHTGVGDRDYEIHSGIPVAIPMRLKVNRNYGCAAVDLFKLKPVQEVKQEIIKTEQPLLLEQRIAALEAEVAFLKNLPPTLMETLGYTKVKN